MAATDLILRFGSPSRALAASERAIVSAVRDAGIARQILAARALIDFGLVTAVVSDVVDHTSSQLARYLATTLGSEQREVLVAIYVDGEGRYLAEERMGSGAIDAVEVQLRPIAERAFELAASGVLLAHNHPSGDARPSRLDRESTQRIAGILGHLDIRLVDHLVIGRGSVFSIAANRMTWGGRRA